MWVEDERLTRMGLHCIIDGTPYGRQRKSDRWTWHCQGYGHVLHADSPIGRQFELGKLAAGPATEQGGQPG